MELAAKGWSASAIAAEMFTRSRNSIIGRIGRLRKQMNASLPLGNPNCQYTKGQMEARRRKLEGLPRRTEKSKWERWRARKREQERQVRIEATVAAVKAAATRQRNSERKSEAMQTMRNAITCSPTPKNIWDLGFFDCRFIVTVDELPDETLYCGNRKQKDCVYCAAHAVVAYTSANNRERGQFVPMKTISHPWKQAGRAA